MSSSATVGDIAGSYIIDCLATGSSIAPNRALSVVATGFSVNSGIMIRPNVAAGSS
jgi:hypothetical protein